MKLNVQKAEVERSNLGAETHFQIKTTAHAFEILSSGLYTDNILAVVRELSCNAYDAHTLAGKTDTPFEIHLPNDLEPWFHVRDFGVGLSDEDVMGLYTTYFDSTKSDSNEFIGALGLGSKSPFSYATSFEVESRFNGKQRSYTVFINEVGVPTIVQMGKAMETDAENGIQVKLAVKREDFYTFQSKTNDVLRWFENQPTIVGVADINIRKLPEPIMSGTNWKLLKQENYSEKVTAVQGNVSYRCDINKHITLPKEVAEILRSSHLVMFFNIGELDVAASREEIRYTDFSIEQLNKTIKVIITEIQDELNTLIDAIKGSKWTRYIKYNDLSNDIFGSLNSLRSFAKIADDLTDNKSFDDYANNHGQMKIDPTGYVVYSYSASRGYGSTLTRNRVGSVTPTATTEVFLLDQATGGISRLAKRWYSEANIRLFYVIIKNKNAKYSIEQKDKNGIPQKPKLKPLTEKDYEKELKKLVRSMGSPKLLSVKNDTPAAEKRERSSVPGAYQFNGVTSKSSGRYYYNSSYVADWKAKDKTEMASITDPVIFFPLRNRKHILSSTGDKTCWEDSNIKERFNTMLKIINEKHNSKYENSDLYGVNLQTYEKLKKTKPSNWINLYDLFNEAIPNYVDHINFVIRVRRTEDPMQLLNIINRATFTDLCKALPNKSVFKKTVKDIVGQYEAHGKFDKTLETECEFIKSAAPFTTGSKELFVDNDIKPLYNAGTLTEKYPMMKILLRAHHTFIDLMTNDAELEILFDYITLTDRS